MRPAVTARATYETDHLGGRLSRSAVSTACCVRVRGDSTSWTPDPTFGKLVTTATSAVEAGYERGRAGRRRPLRAARRRGRAAAPGASGRPAGVHRGGHPSVGGRRRDQGLPIAAGR